MAKWLNRTLVQAPRNGTTTHTVTFTAATAGSLLVLVLEAGVTHTVPTGWTRQAQALNNTELSVYTKTATAGEASFSTTHSSSNFPMAAEVFEFAAGSTWVGGVSGSGLAFGAANPTLSGLTGTNLLFGVIGYGEWNGTTRATAWTGTPTPVEDSDVCAPAAGQGDGYEYSLAYVEDATATSFAPVGAITPTTGTNTTKEALTFAVKVPAGTPTTTGANGLNLAVTGAASSYVNGLSKVAEVTAAVLATAGATFNLTVPAGVTTSHLGVLVTSTDSPGTTTVTASGWTSRVANPTGQTNSEFSVLTRLGGLVAGNTVPVTLSTARNTDVTAIWFDTSNRDVAVVGTAGTRSGTSQSALTIPGLTTTAAYQPVLIVAAERTTATGTVVSSWTPATPQQQHFHEGTAAAASQYVGLLNPATAGAVPAETVTYSGASGNAAGVMLAISTTASVPTTTGAVGINLATTGASSTVATGTGQVRANLALTGTAATTAASTGGIGAGLGVTGTASTTATATGSVPLSLGITGSASTVTTTTGTLTINLGATGAATAVSNTTGTLTLGLNVTGAADSVTTVETTGALTLGTTLTGTAATVAATTGALTLALGLTTVSGSDSSTQGSLQLTFTLAGTASSSSTTTGALTLTLTPTGTASSFSGIPHNVTITGTLHPRQWAGVTWSRNKHGHLDPNRWDGNLA